jgi:hypothetical protein
MICSPLYSLQIHTLSFRVFLPVQKDGAVPAKIPAAGD